MAARAVAQRRSLYEKIRVNRISRSVFHDKADLENRAPHWRTEGYTYANVDSVDVTVRGVGGHGAYPHKTKDPIVLAAEMINDWQTIASRENNPLDPIVVHGGFHPRPEQSTTLFQTKVKMQLTVRTYKAETA